MAVEILYPADRAAWLAARKQDVTASVAGCLLGVHPYTTAYGLWAEKSGRIEVIDEDSPQKRRGRLLEPVIFAMLAEERPDWTIEYPLDNRYYRDPEARRGATPDAFAGRPDIFGAGIVQGKTVSEQVYREQWIDEEGEVVLPLWIAVQAIQEAALTKAYWASVALMVVGRGIDLKVIDVPLHIGVMHKLQTVTAEFWRLVDTGLEPDPDWLRDGATVLDVYRDSTPDRRDLTDLAWLDQMLGRYVDASEARGISEQAIDRIRPEIIHALGNAEAGFTENWTVSARTSVRVDGFGRPVKSRVLRIKPREVTYADRF